jgi:serine/threonine-protein kinase
MIDKKILIPKHTKIRDTYTVDSFLGDGAFGAVYKVRHKYLGLQAIKVFHPGSIPKQQEPELFNEAFILSKLTHENIVRVYEANVFELNKNRFCYIAMEFVQGGTLSEYLEHETRIPIDLAVDIQKDICRGLAQLHKSNPPLVHRDVKPQNVMLSRTDKSITAKVSDFGLAKHVDPITRVTEAAGTLAYLPPEGFWDYETSASDVFSAGIIFYIMLAGVPPFKMPRGYNTTKKSELQAAIKASRNRIPDPPSKYNIELQDQINDVVLKALEPDIKRRYKDAQEFYSAIEQYQNQKNQIVDEGIKNALELGKQYNSLKEAIKLLESAISKASLDKQRFLKEKYKHTLDTWKKGVIM